MEIQYEKFNKIREGVDKIQHLMSSDTILDAFIPNYFDGLKESEIEAYYNITDEIERLLSDDLMGLDILNEVQLNIANISNDDQVKRYLSFLIDCLTTMLELCRSYLPNDLMDIQTSRMIIYEQTKLGNTRDDVKRYFRFNDPTMEIKVTHLSIIEKIDELKGYIIDKLQLEKILSSNEDENMQYDLTANTHKLILMYRLGLFDTLYEKHYGHLGPGKFAKLIGTLIGVEQSKSKQESFKKSVDDFINETYFKKQIKKTVESVTAVRKVHAYLTEIGLTDCA